MSHTTTAVSWITVIALCGSAAACTKTIDGTPSPATTASQGSSASSSASGQSGAKGAIALGDLDTPPDAKSVGAPFDPCAVGWDAFPAEVRPEPDKKPRLRGPDGNGNFTTGCRYDNSGSITISADPKAGPAELGSTFITLVVWGAPGTISADPAKNAAGGVPATFGGKPGLTRAGKDSKGQPTCIAIVQLANGAGGASVTNGKFPAVDACAIASSVATKIAAVTP